MKPFAGFLLAVLTATAATHTPPPLTSPLEDKNFYFLTLIARTPAAADAVRKDAALGGLTRERNQMIEEAHKTCGVEIACYAKALQWTPEQIAAAGRSFTALYQSSAAFKALVDGPLRDSGMYIRYDQQPGPELTTHALEDCLRGINHVIDVYAMGKAPHYPAIDSITYDPKSQNYPRVIENLVSLLVEDAATLTLPYSASLRMAGEVLRINTRNEAARLEPMERGENAAVFQHIKAIDWKKYPYTVIVVPGAGNDRPGIPLSAAGMVRDEIAAKRYRDGKAPLILVSGGYVHPAQTPYAEALEMKRDLMARFNIPASAIIIDPHARHTTTNMRNAARLMYRYGVPFDKKALVTTDSYQSKYIEDAGFAKRCRDELGYLPYKLLGRTTPFDLEFLPTIESLHADPLEPLDP